MINNFSQNSKINVNWTVNPYDFSKEKISLLKKKISSKYNVPKENIKIIPDFIILNKKGEQISFTNDIIANIQNADFQLRLFHDYLKINDIQNIDFDLIKSIDNEINAQLSIDNNKKFSTNYKINWVKWSNFLSYGENNFFDFSSLKGLILLNGEPANQSGKTTFAIDLLHFLLFGKTIKSTTIDKIFNKYLNEATDVLVEGSLTINDVEYIIKRELHRPALNKRTPKSKTLQKVSYYKVVNSNLEELTDYVENQEEENSVQTNKIIKETIGNEEDFDMIVCATNSNLDDLIDKKETERGRILSKWIGLNTLEEKEVLAKEKFNTKIKPYLLSNRYSKTEIEENIEKNKVQIETYKNDINRYEKDKLSIEQDILQLEEQKKVLLSALTEIDNSLLKIDSHSLENELKQISEQGKKINFTLENIREQLKSLENIDFSIQEYDNLNNEIIELHKQYTAISEKKKYLLQLISQLEKSEYCPTCGRKYENIDNSGKIKELNIKLEEIEKIENILNADISKKNQLLQSMKENREKYELKSKLTIKKSALELQVEQLRNLFKDKNLLLKEYLKNTLAIDKNNELNLQIRNLEFTIKNKYNTNETNIRYIEKYTHEINTLTANNKEYEEYLIQMSKEEILVYHWRIYLELVGKNGITKMVLRKTLPIINAQIAFLLNDVCDFDIEVEMNEKNDINFLIVKDGVKSTLNSASGFERTAAALSLRAVLANISYLPKLNGLVLDEILGRVAKENYDNMRLLYEKILKNFDYIIQISHLDEIKDWHNTIITIKKDNNVSSITRTDINKIMKQENE